YGKRPHRQSQSAKQHRAEEVNDNANHVHAEQHATECKLKGTNLMSTKSVATTLGRAERVDPQVGHAGLRNWLLDALTLSSGAIDAISFLGLGKVFTAFMTGNVAFLGMAIAANTGVSPIAPPHAAWVLASMGGFAAGIFLA